MRYKATFLAGLAGGIHPWRPGRQERYETIRRASRRVVENPSVQEAAGVLQAQASDYAGTARKKVGDTLDDKIGDKVPPRFRTRMHMPASKHAGADGQQRM